MNQLQIQACALRSIWLRRQFFALAARRSVPHRKSGIYNKRVPSLALRPSLTSDQHLAVKT